MKCTSGEQSWLTLQISSGCLRGQSGAGKIDRNGIATLQTEKNATLPKRKRGGQPGNHNAEGAGAPLKNHNAEKHGLFRKYLPEETFSIIAEMPVNPLDVLWDQIQIAYAAIIRAQQIMYVRDQTDKTREMVSDSAGGESWKTQQAWDKQADFLKSQARAQSELRSMIKQYDEMLLKTGNWQRTNRKRGLNRSDPKQLCRMRKGTAVVMRQLPLWRTCRHWQRF